MYIGDIEITPREAIFSVTIASVLFLVGFFISSKIEHSVNQSHLQYRQAAQIPDNNEEEFALAMKTDVGNAFVDGKFEAVDAVSHEKLDGKWLYIHADHQQYTMHTRVVTYTTTGPKGRTQTHTRLETYWTWDTKKTEELHSRKVRYIGSEFNYEKFNYTGIKRHYERVDNGWRKRIEFTCISTNFNAGSYVKLENGTVPNGTCLFQNKKVADLYKDFTTSYMVVIFWSLWVGLMVIAVIAFVAIENDWMEDGV